MLLMTPIRPKCFSFLRLHESSIPLVPYMLFGDFNFRLDNKRVVEVQSKSYGVFTVETEHTVL